MLSIVEHARMKTSVVLVVSTHVKLDDGEMLTVRMQPKHTTPNPQQQSPKCVDQEYGTEVDHPCSNRPIFVWRGRGRRWRWHWDNDGEGGEG